MILRILIACICMGLGGACEGCNKKHNKNQDKNKKDKLNQKTPIPVTDEIIAVAKNYTGYGSTTFLAEVLEKLKNNEPVDINAKDSTSGETALHQAIRVGDPKIVAALLSRDKLDVNVTCNYGDTPLLGALQPHFMDVLDLLLNDPRTDINKAEVGGHTPLYRAVENNYKEIVGRLLKANGIEKSFNIKYMGNTPLSIAKSHGKSEIEALLQAAGATE